MIANLDTCIVCSILTSFEFLLYTNFIENLTIIIIKSESLELRFQKYNQDVASFLSALMGFGFKRQTPLLSSFNVAWSPWNTLIPETLW